jgi:hypothetical protein
VRIENLSINLRRRTPWEALDLGHGMLRAWAGPAYRAWAVSYWAVGLPLLLLLWPWQEFGFLILWWLKPLFDRVLLYAYSRSLFDTPTSATDVWRALPGLLRGPGLLSALTLRRLSMARSFLLPVWQLEDQRGAAARARFRLLARRSRGYAVWLTFVCANLASVLGFSLILLLETFAPLGSEGLFSFQEWFSGDMPTWKHFLANLLFMVAESLVEPFYVASGFALYLNRRSELEGWDIELAFRRLAARKAVAPVLAALLPLLVVVGLCIGTVPSPAWAGDGKPAASEARRTIDAVLADPVFGREEEKFEWRAIPKKDQDRNTPDWLKPYLRFIEFLGQVLRGFVWVGALLLAAVLLYLVIHYREAWFGRRRQAAAPEFLFGLDVRPGSLPADVVAAARQAAAAGRIDEALSLLYRGALVVLIHRRQVDFRAGDTEGDCLDRVHDHLADDARRHFAELLAAWQAAAYAHRQPPPAAVERLCADWSRHFGTAEANP